MHFKKIEYNNKMYDIVHTKVWVFGILGILMWMVFFWNTLVIQKI